MHWVVLCVAVLLEVVWAVGLKQSAGFTRLGPSVITIVALATSLGLLGLALRTLPLGTAYAVWVGIGAVGASIAGVVLFQELLNPLKVASMLLVVAGIAGLKLASGAQ